MCLTLISFGWCFFGTLAASRCCRPACTRKTRVIDVVYNASNNELVRTKTLVKGAIIQIDATPFRQWYEAHYGVEVGKKKGEDAAAAPKADVKKSKHVKATVCVCAVLGFVVVFLLLGA
jgi:ribosomal protein S8E